MNANMPNRIPPMIGRSPSLTPPPVTGRVSTRFGACLVGLSLSGVIVVPGGGYGTGSGVGPRVTVAVSLQTVSTGGQGVISGGASLGVGSHVAGVGVSVGGQLMPQSGAPRATRPG